MKKLIVWAVLSAAVAVLPSCGDDEGEGCSTPVISEVNYSPKNPSKSEEVTVTARIRNEHCPFQACVTYQVDSITGTWGNTTESYRSTDPVYSTGRDLRLHGQDSRHEADRSQGAFYDRSDHVASPLCLF